MEIPVFKPSVEAVASVEPQLENSKTVDTIAAQASAEYGANESAEELSPTGRKRRADLGQKRGPRGPRKNSVSGQGMVDSKGNETAGFILDKAIVSKTCKVVLTTVDKAVARKVYFTTVNLGGDKAFAGELAGNVALQESESEMIAELTGIIFEKHGWLTGHAPEILLGVMLSEWGIRIALTMRTLNQMNEDLKAKRKAESVSKPSTN